MMSCDYSHVISHMIDVRAHYSLHWLLWLQIARGGENTYTKEHHILYHPVSCECSVIQK